MTVAELIEALRRFPHDAKVFVFDDLDFERDVTLAPEAEEVVPVLTGGHGGVCVTEKDRSDYWSRPAVVIR
jgi:hypothetical protein